MRVGWWTRVQVFFGVACTVFVTNWTSLWIYVAIWGLFTYQLALTVSYHRGMDDGAIEVIEGLRGIGLPVNEEEGERFVEMFEMAMTRKQVALQDLAEICDKYGIPREEMLPIVDRGF